MLYKLLGALASLVLEKMSTLSGTVSIKFLSYSCYSIKTFILMKSYAFDLRLMYMIVSMPRFKSKVFVTAA